MNFDTNYKYGWYNIFCVVVVAFAIAGFLLEPKHEIRWEFKGPVTRVKYDKSTPEVTINRKRYALSLVLWDNDLVIHVGDTLVKHRGSKIFMCIRCNTRDTVYGHIHRFNNKDRERNRREDAMR